MDKSKLEEYGRLKLEIKQLDERVKALQPEITEMIIESGYEDEGVEVDGLGVFTITKRREWTYPAEVKELETEYKKAKKMAEQDGSAEYTENKSVMFKA